MKRIVASICLVSALASGCAAVSTDVESYVDPVYENKSFDLIAVYSNVEHLNHRKLLEVSIVDELNKRGVAAQSAMQILPPTRQYTIDEERSKFIELGMDAILFANIAESGSDKGTTGVSSQTFQYPGHVTNVGGASYAMPNPLNNTVTSGGQSYSKPWLQLDSSLVDLANMEKAWIADADSRGSSYADVEMLIQDYSVMLVERLIADGLIVPKEISVQ